MLADAVSSRISYFFSDPKNRSENMIIRREDVYPNLYQKEMDAEKEDRELEEFKDRRRAFVGRWNRRFKGDSNESGSSQANSVD